MGVPSSWGCGPVAVSLPVSPGGQEALATGAARGVAGRAEGTPPARPQGVSGQGGSGPPPAWAQSGLALTARQLFCAAGCLVFSVWGVSAAPPVPLLPVRMRRYRGPSSFALSEGVWGAAWRPPSALPWPPLAAQDLGTAWGWGSAGRLQVDRRAGGHPEDRGCPSARWLPQESGPLGAMVVDRPVQAPG